MDVEIRVGGPEDAEAIAVADVGSWQETYAGQMPQHYLDQLSPRSRAARWAEWLSPPQPAVVFVADTADGVVGFAYVGPPGTPMT